ncbi:MAG: hypothetical protein ACLT69_15250 [Intestinibacter bartlettii]
MVILVILVMMAMMIKVMTLINQVGDSAGNDNNKDESTADRIGIDTNKNNDISINN